MIKFFHSILCFLLMLCFGVAAHASREQENTAPANESSISIIGPHVPSLLDEENPGPYNQIFEIIFKNIPMKKKLNIMPINRAHKMFLSGKADCLFLGANRPEYYASEGAPNMLISANMNRLFLKAYTRIDDTLIQSTAALENKILAGEVGVLQNFVDYTDKPLGAQLLPVASNAQAFTMLRQNRVDIVIAFTLDAEFYFSEHGRQSFHASETFSVFENSEAIVCHPTNKGQQVINYVNPIIHGMLDSGEMSRLLGLPN